MGDGAIVADLHAEMSNDRRSWLNVNIVPYFQGSTTSLSVPTSQCDHFRDDNWFIPVSGICLIDIFGLNPSCQISNVSHAVSDSFKRVTTVYRPALD